ncbi:Hypothetical protein CINCED_3A013632 [Cinara cedri]|uniref:Uncharacterized protein n=1 Tax=Cinara cedri TaxID=506608 RepID=A0A5E4M7C8_9HEMI|nr:Hypothetical protein CINCED_3A013632 [Cinara cedri]
MSDIVEHIKKENIMLTANPVSNVLGSATVEVPATAYRMCNPPYASIGNSIIKPGIPKLSACEVSDDDVSICPVILHPTKQLSSPVQIKTENLIKTIGFSPARSQLTSAQPQNHIVTSSIQRSIMESQNISPLIITPKPIHTNNEIVPAKIVPFPPDSHFSVINNSNLGSYDNLPVFSGTRPSLLSGTPPIYTQSDFARFPPKSYPIKSSVINPAVIHGPIHENNEDICLNIPNSQHLFKPIISPRPSILRKRDADGMLRGQKHLLPIIKPDPEDCQNVEETTINRNGFSETGIKIESIMVPQIPEAVLPQISALSRQSHIMVEISPRKKPRKQLLPVNQDNTFQIINDEMEYVGENNIKIEKSEYFEEEEGLTCGVDADEDIDDDDDLYDDDEMDIDDDFPGEDDYDQDDEFENDFADGLEIVIKSEKPITDESKPAVTTSDENAAPIKVKNKRPSLLAHYRRPLSGQSYHFLRDSDFKIKETKRQLAELRQTQRWFRDCRSGWRVKRMIKQFETMVNQ